MKIAESNFSLVVFGASGALAKYKIFPALYQMALEGRMPAKYCVWGFSRTEKSHHEFRDEFTESIRKYNPDYDPKILDQVLQNVFYFTGDYNDMQAYQDFSKMLEAVEEDDKDRVRLAYFSVPPSVFEPIIKGLGTSLRKSDLKLRLILEKPFGNDLQSAKKLKDILTLYFEKEDIFLLDHYLGKEGVFNLLSLRYANPIFSFLLQGKYISNVQITAMESEGLEGRAGYFDAVGTLKDMVQSHLLQIMAFFTMHVPRQFNSDLVHKEKTLALSSLYFDASQPDAVVRGQYDSYLTEAGISPESKTETYVALKLGIDNSDWHGVPFYLRAGKCLSQKWTAVVVEFKSHVNQKNLGLENVNRLVIEIQPQEKVEFYLYTKLGGEELEFVPLTTGKPIYCSGDCLVEHARLLIDVIKGDRLLFLDFAEIYESWKIVDQVVKANSAVEKYEPKSYGPTSADKMINWFNPKK